MNERRAQYAGSRICLPSFLRPLPRHSHEGRPISLNGGEDGQSRWLQMFGLDCLDPLPAEQRGYLIARVEESARPALYHDGRWTADPTEC